MERGASIRWLDRWPTQARFWLEWGNSLRLADQKVDVLEHYDISIDTKLEAAPSALSEDYEMALPGVVITREAQGMSSG